MGIKNNISKFTILAIMAFVFATNASHKFWAQDSRIIEWDVKSYYAYLPATFIYHDLTFDFVDKNPSLFKNIWPLRMDNGKNIIITSMGMSYLYLPAFLVAHQLAEPLGYEADGYTRPYKFAIVLLAFIYLFIGLLILRKILLNFYNDITTSLTLGLIAIGTNLLYYSSYESGMTHVYNFTLITAFLYHIIAYYKNFQIKRIIYLGLLGGLITLIRPTNILIFIVFLLWDVSSLKEFKARISLLLKNYLHLLAIAILFLIPWIPQFAYWKMQTGTYMFFSYGVKDGKFFFTNPQITNILFSYWKGWYVYTPIMFIATIGLIRMIFTDRKKALGISIYLALVIYVLSSWWSWWFGGSFGQRSFVDIYGLMAIPLASITSFILTKNYFRILYIFILLSLTWYNIFQKNQFLSGALHYWSMTKELYWEQFLIEDKTENYYKFLKIPDYEAAHEGIYRLIQPKTVKKKHNRAGKVFGKPDVYFEYYTIKINTSKQYLDSLLNIYPDISDLSLNEKVSYLYKKINKGKSKKEILAFYNSYIRKNYINECTEKSISKKINLDTLIMNDARWYLNTFYLDKKGLLEIYYTEEEFNNLMSKEIIYK